MDITLTESEKIKILNSTDIYRVMQQVLLREQKIDRNRRHYWVIGLEDNNRLLFVELISMGSVTQAIVEPMEVYSFALQKRAVKVILVHNSPTGELVATDQDKDLTDQLIQAGRIVHTVLLDHLIISEKSYMSFVDTGLMLQLEKSIKYVPEYELKERMRREISKKVERRKALAIARALKRKYMPIDEIAEVTGLSEAEIEKIKLKESPETDQQEGSETE